MSRMKAAEEDLRHTTRLVKPMLGMVGAWPIPSSSSLSSKLLQRIEHVITYFLLLIMIVPGLLYVFLKEKNNKVKLKLIGPIINWAMQLVKYTILLFRMKSIRVGLEMVRQDWMDATEENRMIFKSKAKIGRRMMLIVAFTMYGGGMCYRIILPLLRGTIVTPDNITIRPVPCASYFIFFNEQLTPNYEIVFTLQILAGFATYAVLSGSCGICALLVLHTCSLLRILVNKMNALMEDTDINEAAFQRRIKDIVEHQAKIKKFLNNIETITEYICLTEMLGGTFLVCLGLHIILTAWEDGSTMTSVVFVILITSCSLCVFVLCYIGQLLVDESTDVGQTSCTLNWYRLPAKRARYLVLIIAVSNHPMKLTAGKMLEMSLTSFTDVIKVAVGYFNMLHKLV